MAIGVKRIETVYLPVTNPQHSSEWYEAYLGLNLFQPAGENQAQLTCASGQSIFLIRTPERVNLTYHEVTGEAQCILTLEVEDFEALYHHMMDKGIKVSAIEDNGACGLNFFVFDPDGNKLDIWSGWPTKKK